LSRENGQKCEKKRKKTFFTRIFSHKGRFLPMIHTKSAKEEKNTKLKKGVVVSRLILLISRKFVVQKPFSPILGVLCEKFARKTLCEICGNLWHKIDERLVCSQMENM